MSDAWIDKTAPVRDGEGLDRGSLEGWLREHVEGLEGELEIEQFRGGHSNLTYMLRMGGREMVLRRPPFGGTKIKTAHDMGREFRILSALDGVYDKAPTPHAHCEDESVIGAPFYVMERVRGVILRQRPPKGLELTPERMGVLSRTLVDNLVAIHGVDLAEAGLDTFGRPEGYVRRQVEGWTRRYEKARTDDLPAIEAAAAWLAENMPPESGASLIHNDYKYDNLVFDPERFDQGELLAVLDWEMATVGDPLMDLGTSIAYWVDPDDPQELRLLPFGPTSLDGNLRRLEVAERYADKSGRSLDHILFYYVYALFKVAVILQQIYARYKRGLTQDPRFAIMIEGVKLIGLQASRALDKGRIDRLGAT